MKLLAIMLSILTMTLSFIPCDDERATSEQVVFASQESDKHCDDFSDLCTPFCSCVCCARVIVEQNAQQSIQAVAISSKQLRNYTNVIHSSDFLDEILHPPRA